MLSRNLENFTEADIQQLVVNKVTEGKTLDYKAELKIGSDEQRKDFLADVSSFANTEGGFLIYGLLEKKENGKNAGYPDKIVGIKIDDTEDNIKRKVLEMISSSIDPRIFGINTRFIKTSNEELVFIIYIPKSWSAPHMVTYKNSSRFYARNGSGKYQLDVREIKSSFLQASDIFNKLQEFRSLRISKIMSDDIPIKLGNYPRLIIELFPFSLRNQDIDIKFLHHQHIPLNYDFYCWEIKTINFDGLLFCGDHYKDGVFRGYLQLFRNGVIEFAMSEPLWKERDKVIPSLGLEDDMTNAVNNCLLLEKYIGIEEPYYLSICMLGFKGYQLATGPSPSARSEEFDRDILVYPELQIDKTNLDTKSLIQPILDHIWQSVGIPESLFKDWGKR